MNANDQTAAAVTPSPATQVDELCCPFSRLKRMLAAKLSVGPLLILWVGGPYFGLQFVEAFPVTLMPRSVIDHAVPFNDATVWLYLSMYVLIPLSWFMLAEPIALKRFALGVMLLGAASALVFLFRPTMIQRPELALDELNWGYRLVLAADRPVNAFPSLHASLCVYAAFFLHGMGELYPRGLRLLLRGVLWLWVLGILYSTLATRQHVFADIAVGAAMAFVMDAMMQRFLRFPKGGGREGGRADPGPAAAAS